MRRFFQYLVLYGLLVVTAIGLSGLLGRLADRGAFVEDESGLALSLAFTVVGLPLFTAVALWSRRNLRADPAEVKSVAWAAYVTLAALTSLSVAVDARNTSLQGLFGVGPDGAQGAGDLHLSISQHRARIRVLVEDDVRRPPYAAETSGARRRAFATASGEVSGPRGEFNVGERHFAWAVLDAQRHASSRTLPHPSARTRAHQ